MYSTFPKAPGIRGFSLVSYVGHSVKVQLVNSTAPADWAALIIEFIRVVNRGKEDLK